MSRKNSILDLSEPKKQNFLISLYLQAFKNFMLNWIEHKKGFITLGPGLVVWAATAVCNLDS